MLIGTQLSLHHNTKDEYTVVLELMVDNRFLEGSFQAFANEKPIKPGNCLIQQPSKALGKISLS